MVTQVLKAQILTDGEVDKLKLLPRGRTRRYDALRDSLAALQPGQGFLYPFSDAGRLVAYGVARDRGWKVQTSRTEDKQWLFIKRVA